MIFTKWIEKFYSIFKKPTFDFGGKPIPIKKVWVDEGVCTWHQICIPEAPGLIEFDDALVSARVREEVLKRNADELRSLINAADVCPMPAIKIELENGKVIDPDDPEFKNIVDAEVLEWSDFDNSENSSS